MPLAPLNEVRKVIQYATSVIPSKKIIMGIPFYGYGWTLPYVPKGEFAQSIGNEEAIELALKYHAAIDYDPKAHSPHFRYKDEKGLLHEVWFEDTRSIQANFKLASEFNLRGVSYWALGKPFTANWTALENMFKIANVIK